jgi:hypothetical protein
MKTTLALILGLMVQIGTTSAQCSTAVKEKLNKNAANTTVLKRIEMKMKEIENVPFSSQYSYVFTKENDYLINVEYDPSVDKSLVFTLSNSDGEVINAQLENVPEMGTTAWRFNSPSTGIYYLNFHAQQSFNACAAFQILKTNSGKKNAPCPVTKTAKPIKDFALLKKFKVDNRQEYEYSYVFSKGKLYHFALPSDDIELTLLNADKVKMEPYDIVKNKDGSEIGYDSRKSGIVYIKLKSTSPCSLVGFYFKDKP